MNKYKLTPNPKLDQNFLIDEKIIQKLVDYGDISKTDRVLEIGSGLGFLTEKLADVAKEVITFEIDKRYEDILKQVKGPVRIIYEDIYKYLEHGGRQKIGTIHKVISNMPFSFIQPLLHQFTTWGPPEMIWLTPASFVEKVNNDHILGAYFNAKLLEKVSQGAFYPIPNTVLAIIKINRIPDPIETNDYGIFIRRQLYKQEDKKLKNALREILINAKSSLAHQRITKNQARRIIKDVGIDTSELAKLVAHIKPETYFAIAKKVNNIYSSSEPAKGG